MAVHQSLDRPDVRSVVDVLLDDGILGDGTEVLTSVVHGASANELVVGVGRRMDGRAVRLDPGTGFEVLWKGDGCLLRLPVELTAVDPGADPCWRLKVTDQVVRVQRREAVRAPARWTVVVEAGGPEQHGWTVDVSETGLRCTLPAAPTGESGTGGPAGAGEALRLQLQVGERTIGCAARLVRVHPRTDKLWEASLQFEDLPERDGDRVREAVFARLRELRAQGHA